MTDGAMTDMNICNRHGCQTTAGCICDRTSRWLGACLRTPVMVSQGGIAYNHEHIDYWRERALKAEAELARRTPGQ